MPRLTTPIPASAAATQFDLRQIALHDDVQRIGIGVALLNDAGQVLRHIHRVFTYEEIGVAPAMTLAQLRTAALQALRALADIN